MPFLLLIFTVLCTPINVVHPMNSIDRTELLTNFLQEEGVQKFIRCAEEYPLTSENSKNMPAEFSAYRLWNPCKEDDPFTQQTLLHTVETKLYYLALTYLHKNANSIPEKERPDIAKYLANRTVDTLWQIKHQRQKYETEQKKSEATSMIVLPTKSQSFDALPALTVQPQALELHEGVHQSISYESCSQCLDIKPTKIIEAYFSVDNRYLIIFLFDGTILLWSIKRKMIIKKFHIKQLSIHQN